MKRALYAIPLSLAIGAMSTFAALAADKTDQSNVPTELRVRDGYKRVLTSVGRGVQIYDCVDGAWKLRAPRADIFEQPSDKQVATHFAGPTWESTKDGSKVVGALDAPPVAAPNPQQDIPWLRLRAASNVGKGTFDDVAYIQRLNTRGGVAPTGACAAGQTVEAPYQATYDFWAPSN